MNTQIKIRHILFATAMACTMNFVNAQQRYTKYDDLPGIIKSYKPSYSEDFPAWAKMLYSDNINFNTINALFQKEEGNGMDEEDGKETPIKRYYLIWRKAVMPYAKKDGTITIPSNLDEIKKKLTGVQSAPATAKVDGTANWSFKGPKETLWENDGYVHDHNEAPDQANVYSFDVSNSNPSILFAGTETGFLNKTIDKGLHWTLMARNYRFGGSITAIAIHPTNPKIVYVSAGGQVHKSTDGGTTFTPLLQSGSTFSADRLRIDTANPNKIYASSGDGLFLSTNAGTNWVKKISSPCWDAEIQPGNSQVVYALAQEKNTSGTDVFVMYLSTNGGTSFIKDNNFNFNDDAVSGGLLAVTPASSKAIFAAVLSSDDTPKIYKGTYNTSTHTITWAFVNKGKTANFKADNWQGYYDLVFEVSPANANTIFFGTSGLYKSTNGGASFTPLWDYGATAIIELHPDAQDMKLINGTEAWVSSDGGLTYTTDAFTKNINAFTRNNGVVGSDFWGFDQGWNEDLMVGGRYHNGNTAVGEYYSDKALRLGGAESPTGWIMPGKTRHAAFDDLGGGHILPASLTAQEEGTFPFTKYPNDYYYGYRKSSFVVHPNYYNVYYMGIDNGIWKSVDGGNSYTLLHDFGNEVWQIQISRKNPNVMYADVSNAGLFRSDDGGNTWVAKPSLTADPYGYDWWRGDLTFVISPFDENVIYACPQDNWPDNVRKIFRSADGGNTWTDWTTTTIHDYGTKWLCIQPLTGNKDGVYLFTNNSWYGSIGGKVFFRASDMSDWVDYSNNFPAAASIDFASAIPFYRDGKLRATGNMGIWETPLYSKGFPVTAINPMVDKNKGYECARDTFYFDDYSIVNHAGTTWSWSFNPAPAYISDANVRNPKVVFGSVGKYSVTEKITRSGKTYSKTIKDMVDISSDICGTVDTIPGNAVSFSGEAYVQIPSFNLAPTNHFTFSVWIKPDAVQKDWSGLIMPIGNGFSLNLLTSMELRYGSYWWVPTNAFVVPGKWNHVALVVEPTKATIYVNGVPYVVSGTNAPAAFDKGTWLGTQDGWGTDRAYTGLMDELCFWNRSLSQNEIREQMHLVKNVSDAAFIHYYQFNETSGGVAFDKIALDHIQVGALSSISSSAPVGAGVSKRLSVTAAGSYLFGNTGVTINFAAGTVPNGEVCVTRINQNSQNSSSANKNLLFGKYWVMENYGTNKTITNVSSMKFDDCGAVTANEIGNPSKIKLFKRGSFDDASANWVQAGTASQVVSTGSSSNISFTSPSVTNLGQFELQRTDATLALQSIALHAEILNTKAIAVIWETTGEDAIDNYIIERSTDGIHFIALGDEKAINTVGSHKYIYTDAKPANGELYYRIKVIHENATPAYSDIARVTFNQLFSLFELSPNPLQRDQLLAINTVIAEPYVLRIYNGEGKEIYNAKLNGNTQIKLNNPAGGVYYYTAVWSTGMKNGKLIVE